MWSLTPLTRDANPLDLRRVCTPVALRRSCTSTTNIYDRDLTTTATPIYIQYIDPLNQDVRKEQDPSRRHHRRRPRRPNHPPSSPLAPQPPLHRGSNLRCLRRGELFPHHSIPIATLTQTHPLTHLPRRSAPTAPPNSTSRSASPRPRPSSSTPTST